MSEHSDSVPRLDTLGYPETQHGTSPVHGGVMTWQGIIVNKSYWNRIAWPAHLIVGLLIGVFLNHGRPPTVGTSVERLIRYSG